MILEDFLATENTEVTEKIALNFSTLNHELQHFELSHFYLSFYQLFQDLAVGDLWNKVCLTAFAELEFGNPLSFAMVSTEFMYTEKWNCKGVYSFPQKKWKKNNFVLDKIFLLCIVVLVAEEAIC